MNTVRRHDSLARPSPRRACREQPRVRVVHPLDRLGIGANTAIFQPIDAVEFRTLPVRAPEELVEIQTTFNTWGTAGDSPRRPTPWDRLRQETEPFSAMLAWGTSRFNLSSSGESHFVNGLWVSGDFFNVLGVPPEAGRVFTTRDDTPGRGAAAVVISHAFWQRQYAGAPSAIGQALHLDGHPFEIVGVTPASFAGVQVGKSFDVAVPICAQPFVVQSRSAIVERHFWWLDVFARRARLDDEGERAPGRDLARLQRGDHRAAFPAEWRRPTRVKLRCFPRSRASAMPARPLHTTLWVLFAVAGFVLLIACANPGQPDARARRRASAKSPSASPSARRAAASCGSSSPKASSSRPQARRLACCSRSPSSRFLVSLISTDTTQLF